MEKTNINLKETLNLPKTDFPIRANSAEKEPELLAFWENEKIYEKSKVQQDSFAESFTLHDGPPYPNGNIHMGHALNKVLKDLIVRSKVMSGKKSGYIPGWDCHGLPIETQVLKELKASKEEDKKTDISWFRNRCKEFALRYVDIQKADFQRLGIFGEWDKPYLTLNPQYEAGVVKLFGQMAENGLVYKGRKPIHWCTHCETALAEAEIEYADHRSPSIFVHFDITKASPALSDLLQNKAAALLVWTTTPWTLPANVAVAAHPDFTYVIIENDGKLFICVSELKDQLIEKFEWSSAKQIGQIKGVDLAESETQHPLLDRHSPVVLADYVTKEDGTGFVHIAPGHGQDDYIVGLKYNLPMVMPVDDQGKFTKEVPWEGEFVFDANKTIGLALEENGRLQKLQFIKHSYPHCWRCKNPVIFRATEQWFIAMDKPSEAGTLREQALKQIKDVQWFPDWGEKRITSMVENRPDWCISRQRYWGIPVPVLTCKDCGHSEMTGGFNKAIVDLVSKEGTLAWFEKEAHDFLPAELKCSDCGHRNFKKESDILDVWFESGSSFESVINGSEAFSFPADLYLEGSDQHRGWFQSSLLIGIGSQNKAPFASVLTHGFLVDEKGKKMSKSDGNVIAPEKVIRDMGADILRWWVASTDSRQDVAISQNILKQAKDSFSKVRNTLRFCLSNLFDFELDQAVAVSELEEIDRWALVQLNQLITTVRKYMDSYDYHQVTYALHEFCAVTLSSLYLDMVKDRLYCDGKDSQKRRSCQTAIFYITDVLIRLVAPILVFTSEDAYRFFNSPNKTDSVHLEQLPEFNPEWEDETLKEKWKILLDIKDKTYQKLEQLRSNKTVRSFLEAEVVLTLDKTIDFDDWEALLIVGQVQLKQGEAFDVSVKKADGEKCERCWKILPLKKELCDRCYGVVYP